MTTQPPAGAGWKKWLAGLLTVLTCLGTGSILLVLPWQESWDQNYFSGVSPAWYAVWVNPYFRGAISGVGVLNLYLAVAQLMGLGRAARS